MTQLLRLVVIVCCYLISLTVLAQTELTNIARLKSLEIEINKQPYQVYQQLDSIRGSIRVDDNNELLWFLIRKAQAENLLYFHDAFETTVAEGRSLIRQDSDLEVKALFHVFSGIVQQRKARYTDAIALFDQAISVARANDYLHILIYAKQELGYTRSLSELYESSQAELQEAYIEASQYGNEFLVATINETFGALYGYIFQFKKSIEFYEKALTAYQKLGYAPYVAEALYGLGTTYRYWQKFDKAIEYFIAYNDSLSYTPNQEISFFGHYGLGMTYAEKGDCLHAISVIDQTVAIGGQLDFVAELHKRKASCYAALGKVDAANAALKDAQDIFADMPELDGTTWTLELVKIEAEIADAAKNYPKAIELYKQYYEAYSALLVKNSSERVVTVRAELENDRQRIEINLLKEQAKVKQLQVEQQLQQNKNQSYLIVAACIVIIVIGVLIVVQRNAHLKIIAISNKDVLVNVYNRRFTFNYLSQRLTSMNNNNGDLSIILFDIDNFKQINDQYGHPVGDVVLKKIADIAQAMLRPNDIIGRIGGEEFLCVLDRITRTQCDQVARRILTAIEAHEFDFADKGKFQVTVSIGIADYDAEHSNVQSLYDFADQALYQAKADGKNTIRRFTI